MRHFIVGSEHLAPILVHQVRKVTVGDCGMDQREAPREAGPFMIGRQVTAAAYRARPDVKALMSE